MQGFVSCFGIGMLLSFLSTVQLWSANYTGFASLYTIGNIIALLSMGFLMGALFAPLCCCCQRASLHHPCALSSHSPPAPTPPPHPTPGPKSQCKSMFAETRRIATAVYLILIIVTMSVAFGYKGDGKVALIILCVISHFLALCWYTLSYIPFARQAVTSCLGSCCKMG